MNKKIAAIILAAGKGTRMQMEKGNKVTNLIAGKAIITHIVHFLKKIAIVDIVVVIHHEKESVKAVLREEKVAYVEQEKLLGSNDAVMTGLSGLNDDVTDVMVVYGDDAILYVDKNAASIKQLLELHKSSENVISLLTIEQDNPFGLGRIVRDENGMITQIVEERDATEEQKKITEINPGCFIFSVPFLREFGPQVKKSLVTGELYLTNLIDLAVANGKTVDTVRGGKLLWRGVNTKEELQAAEKLYQDAQK